MGRWFTRAEIEEQYQRGQAGARKDIATIFERTGISAAQYARGVLDFYKQNALYMTINAYYAGSHSALRETLGERERHCHCCDVLIEGNTPENEVLCWECGRTAQ